MAVTTLQKIALCDASDVEEGTACRLDVGDLELALFNVGGQFYLTQDQCTHGAASLSEGFIDGRTIVCDLHEGGFDLETGQPVLPPCIVPIRTYPTSVEDGVVYGFIETEAV